MLQRILADPKDNRLVSDSMIAVTNVVIRVSTVSTGALTLLSAVRSVAM